MKNLPIPAIIVSVALFAYPIITGGSETMMVNLSYLAVPLLVFGLAGLMKRNLKVAIIAAVTAFLLHIVFMIWIFPML